MTRALVLGLGARAGLPAGRRTTVTATAVDIENHTWTASADFTASKDGTVDLAEAKAAASKLFDKLDHDKDGTLDAKELRGRISAKEFAAADPDKDGTLDKNEYMTIVEARFRAADPDNDGTLDAKELATPAGKALLKLLV